MKVYLLLLGIILGSAIASSQVLLQDNFDDGDLTTDASWQGDINEYSSSDATLRLDASEAGTSALFSTYQRADSCTIEVDFSIRTNPSGGNFSRIYLYVDDMDLDNATGYYLQLGESGSDDAIELVELSAGNPLTIARGDMAGIASRPEKKLAITILSDGSFSLVSTDLDDNTTSEEILTMVDWQGLPTAGYFAVYNEYTSSNVQNYWYDNLLVRVYEPDTTPPMLVTAQATDSRSIRLLFDEVIDMSSVDINNIILSPAVEIASTNLNETELSITLQEDLVSGPSYQVTVEGLRDEEGNTAGALSATVELAVPPSSGDLVINEILFNPEGSGSDYIELYNTSDKILALDGIVVSNTTNEQSEIINTDLQMRAGTYALLTEDAEGTSLAYPNHDAMVFVETDLPSFNNADGNMTISVDTGTVVDHVDYDEDWHFGLLDDVDGVSLERIDPVGPSNQATNWQSAAETEGYGTPGLVNSAFVGRVPSGEDFLTLVRETFSPNLDGENDQIAVQYNLPSSGYVTNAFVYDQRGHQVRRLYNQELLGVSGLLTWNGLDDGGRRLPIGPYILHIQLFNLEGDRIDWQAPIVLADRLD